MILTVMTHILFETGSRFTNFKTILVFDWHFSKEKLLEEKTVILELGESWPWKLPNKSVCLWTH